MTVRQFKSLVIFIIVVGILLSGLMIVNTNIQATDLGPGDMPLKLVSNDSLPYPFQDHYLHNNPTPPTADTNSQADLPLDITLPTATTLYDYDAGGDPGRRIKKNGSGASEANLQRYQNWRTGPLSQDYIIDGVVNFPFWSGLQGFGGGRGIVNAFLRDYNGSGYTEITNGTLDISDWQGGSSTWVQKTLAFSSVTYTVPAGNQLEVKITVGAGSASHMWFAWDTTAYDTHLQFP